MAFSKPKAHERAERFAAKGQHDKAAREYQSIVEHDPKDVRAWLMLADCLVRCGDKAGAVERYVRVAQYYVEAKEHNKALAVYRQVLALDAQRLDIQAKVAGLNLQVGHTQDGIALYERVAHAHLQAGRMADALNTYKLVADADPTVVARRLRLAELYSREKRMPEAVDAFRAASKQLRQSGRLADYVRVAERLLYHEEQDLPTIRDLARAYLELGDPRRALMKLNGLLRAHPKDEEGIELLADTFMALGKPEKALSALEELARGLKARGPAAKVDAIRILRRGLEWRPGHAEFREALGELEGRRRTGPVEPVSEADDELEAVEEGDLEELDDDDLVEEGVEEDPSGPVALDEPSAPIALPEAASSAPGTRRTIEVEALPSTEPSLTQSVLSEVEADAALAGGEGLTDFDKILFEAKVYIKYRLFEHALEHVRTALRQQPEHVGAMTVQARAYAELGRTAEAADTHLAVAELVASRDPKLAREQLAAARELAPQHPHLDAVARILGPAAGPGRVAITSRRAPVEDDGDSGAFDLVSSGFDHADLDADLDADLSPPGIALDLDGEAAASLVPVEDVEHSTQPFKPIDFSREPSSPVPPSEHTPAVGFVPVRPPETRGPRRRLGPSVELPLEPEVTPTPAQTGRTLAPYPMDEPPAQTGQTLLHRRGPASGRRLVQEDDELEPARSGRTLVHEPEPARSGRTLVHEPEPARSGRTLVQMPIVDEDGEAVSTDPLEGLDFGGEDDVEVEATDMLGDAGGGDAGVGPDASLIDVEIEVEESVVTTPPAAEAREWADLSDELDEIQFYVDQGLDEDAVVALVDLELQYPGNPQINEFRVRVLGQAPAVAPVAATSTAIHDEELAPLAEPSASLDDEGIEAAETMLDFDIDEAEAEVEAEAAEPLVSLDEEPAEAGEPLVSFDDDDDEDAYLSAIFADPVKKPKAKPRTDDSNPGANLAAGQSVDAATAFDLGVAYREMGLVDAAIAQFETAARDPQWRARALTLLGALRVHRGETDRAIADLKDAVRLASTPAEASEAAYELGVLYEVIGDSEAAIQQLLTVAPGYRDRDERLAELGF